MVQHRKFARLLMPKCGMFADNQKTQPMEMPPFIPATGCGGGQFALLRQPLNIMFDSPRYSSKLANLLEAAGGVDLMVMSHAATPDTPDSFRTIKIQICT